MVTDPFTLLFLPPLSVALLSLVIWQLGFRKLTCFIPNSPVEKSAVILMGLPLNVIWLSLL